MVLAMLVFHRRNRQGTFTLPTEPGVPFIIPGFIKKSLGRSFSGRRWQFKNVDLTPETAVWGTLKSIAG